MCFQFAVRTDLQTVAKPEIVHASVLDRQDSTRGDRNDGGDYDVEVLQQQDLENEFDFGLELLADPENFDSISVPPCLDCVSAHVFLS